MESLVYMVGAVYLSATVARLAFWLEDIIEGRR